MKRHQAVISRIMAAVHSTGTAPEIQLKKALKRRLHRPFRLHPPRIPGRPDFVFHRERVAVFVDGDFWHGHQWRLRGLPSLEHQFITCPNKAYWVRKISLNVQRDKKATRLLHRLGWSVIRIWESEVRKNPVKCVRRIQRLLERRI